jgi:DMSO/TMAO reductase YedYZ molybdopterin-dependent catalytic subunit
MNANELRRRHVVRGILATATAALVSGCDALGKNSWFPKVLGLGERLSEGAHHLVTSRQSMAQEFSEADLSPEFRSNGTKNPRNEEYQALARNGFADWRLRVEGLVTTPLSLTLADLRAMRSRTQITRHDCVEGWSAIGKWTGVPLSEVLARAGVDARARYVVFYCADPMWESETRYYESIDMEDAHHPQTILAYELNGETLPIKNGAPLRLRVERQLGYKMAKYLMRIELVESFARIGGGRGGYWEDLGYEWYAGI